MDQCLIFCRTNLDCDNLEHFMNALGERVDGCGLVRPDGCLGMTCLLWAVGGFITTE